MYSQQLTMYHIFLYVYGIFMNGHFRQIIVMASYIDYLRPVNSVKFPLLKFICVL